MESQKTYHNILKAVHDDFYKDLGKIEFIENENVTEIQIKVRPHEGIHKDKEYNLRLKFQTISLAWPYVFIDSPIYDPIKTERYIKDSGKNGSHKGICIRNIGYGYAFTKNFKNYCNNDWKNYLYYVIVFFNNPLDIEHANGFKTDYKKILEDHQLNSIE